MFTNSVSMIFGGGPQNVIFAENPIKIVVLAYFEKGKKGQKMWTELLSWKSVQGWVENLSNYVAQHNWTDFQLKKLFVFFLLFL